MSTLVRKIGYQGLPSWSSIHSVLPTSTGGVIIVQADNNATGGTAGYGDKTGVGKFYIYESTDRVTFTLRATINWTSGLTDWNTILYSDNSVGIAVANGTGTLQYVKITYGTWTVGAWETVRAAITGTESVLRVELSMTDGDVPIIGEVRKNSTGSTRLREYFFGRRTSDNTWVATLVQTFITSSAPDDTFFASNLIVLKGGTATNRPTVWAISYGVIGDAGVKLYTGNFDETTGQLTNGTLRASYPGDLVSSDPLHSRRVFLWPSAVNEYTLAITNTVFAVDNLEAARGTWDGTTFVPEYYVSADTSSIIGAANLMTATYGNDRINFVHTVPAYIAQYAANFIAVFDRTAKTVKVGPENYWDNKANALPNEYVAGGGTGRNVDNGYHDMIVVLRTKADNTANEVRHHYAKTTRAPAALTPAQGSTMVSATPALTADADLDIKWHTSRIKIEWQFAKDSSFTTNVITYTQPDTSFVWVNGTDIAGSTYKVSTTLPASQALPGQSLWYVRARHVDEFGNKGAWTAANSFTITHPPSATNLQPSGNQQLVFGTGTRTFSWTFSDPSGTDYQTAYRVVVENNDTGAVIHDSGKITSSSTSYTATLATAPKDTLLRWYVILWDKDDVSGAASEYATFLMADPPSVTVTSPTSGGLVTSGVPAADFTVTVGGTRTITRYNVLITQGADVIHNSGDIDVSLASGATVQYRHNTTVLKNTQNYSLQVTVTDSTGLQTRTDPVPFTTQWVVPAAPPAPTVDVANYNVENYGYISVTWNDTDRDVDFSYYKVYRKDDQIDAGNNVLQEGEWVEVDTVYEVNTFYEYRDFYAPSGYKVNYLVTQVVNRFGDSVESTNTTGAAAFPKSDGYWLVEPDQPDAAASAFRLSIVTGDSYTDEYEEEEYIIIGRGRHVDRGERLGVKGQLDVQVRDTLTMSARQKKLRIESIKKENRSLWLRTPFGDSWPVTVGNIGVGRIAGVGTSEFVDMTIPYSEVGTSE